MNSLSTYSYILLPARRSVAGACLRDRLPAEDDRLLEPLPRESGELLFSPFRSVESLLEPSGVCHSPVLRHGDGSAVHLVLRIQVDANWAWRGCVAPGQAESEVLSRIKEGAKIAVGEIGNFLEIDNEEVAGIKKGILSVISGPELGIPVSVAMIEAGKQSHSPQPGSESGEAAHAVLHGVVHAG